MAFREVHMVQVREIIRRWQAGENKMAIGGARGVSARTVGSYIGAASPYDWYIGRYLIPRLGRQRLEALKPTHVRDSSTTASERECQHSMADASHRAGRCPPSRTGALRRRSRRVGPATAPKQAGAQVPRPCRGDEAVPTPGGSRRLSRTRGRRSSATASAASDWLAAGPGLLRRLGEDERAVSPD